VYDPELAHCSSCDPEREAALSIKLEREKAEALKACREAQLLEVELERRRLLLGRGDLGPFVEPAATVARAGAMRSFNLRQSAHRRGGEWAPCTEKKK